MHINYNEPFSSDESEEEDDFEGIKKMIGVKKQSKQS
jgi:hypothetical protein